MNTSPGVGYLFLPLISSFQSIADTPSPVPAIQSLSSPPQELDAIYAASFFAGKRLLLTVRAKGGATLIACFSHLPFSAEWWGEEIRLHAFTTGPIERLEAYAGTTANLKPLRDIPVTTLPPDDCEALAHPIFLLTTDRRESQLVNGIYLNRENIRDVWKSNFEGLPQEEKKTWGRRFKHSLATTLTVFLLVVCSLFSAAQNTFEDKTIKPLSIGSRLPSLTLSPVLHYSSSSLNTAAYNNQLLLLNFVGTNCKSCLQKMPQLDSLQARYRGHLQILLVTAEPLQRVRRFLKEHKLGKTIRLPLLAGDSVLKACFPHEYLSHFVWIKDGMVKAITGSEYVTATNIAKVLSNTPVSWPVKRDVTSYAYSQSLLGINAGTVPDGSFPARHYYAAFSTYLDGVPSRIHRETDTVKGEKRLTLLNQGIISFSKIALGETLDYPSSHLVFEVRDSSRLLCKEEAYKAEWKRSNSFCYEATFPTITPEREIRQRMATDLQLYLAITARKERRVIPCLVLLKKDTSLPSTAAKPANKGTIRQLLYRLNHTLYSQPVLNESGLSPDTPIALPEAAWENLHTLQQVLRNIGFDLPVLARDVEILLIKDTSETTENNPSPLR